jgi:hypothetical protein
MTSQLRVVSVRDIILGTRTYTSFVQGLNMYFERLQIISKHSRERYNQS